MLAGSTQISIRLCAYLASSQTCASAGKTSEDPSTTNLRFPTGRSCTRRDHCALAVYAASFAANRCLESLALFASIWVVTSAVSAFQSLDSLAEVSPLEDKTEQRDLISASEVPAAHKASVSKSLPLDTAVQNLL
eukprot:5957653-Pleurochrysis_carterae.AAC.1